MGDDGVQVTPGGRFPVDDITFQFPIGRLPMTPEDIYDRWRATATG